MSNVYPRETVEFIPVEVTVDGETVTDGVQFCVTNRVTRPTSWISPVTLEGKIGVMTNAQPVGVYVIWAKVTDSPEVPVIRCGEYRVT